MIIMAISAILKMKKYNKMNFAIAGLIISINRVWIFLTEEPISLNKRI